MLVTICVKYSFMKSQTVNQQFSLILILQNSLLSIYFTSGKADTIPLDLSATLANQNKMKIPIISSFTV